MRDAFVGLAKTGTDIRWPGIGSFKIKEQKGRNVRNPRTGEIVYVPSKKVLKFTPSKRLKEDLKALS
jgi:DNA-binding protein HU-beta